MMEAYLQAALAPVVAITPMAVQAQTTPSPGTSQAGTPQAVEPPVASATVAVPSAAETAKLLGNTPSAPTKAWQPFRSRGIALTLTYTGEAAGNMTGGLRRDAAYAGQVFAGLDADLNRIAGIEGATFHVAVTNRHGQSLSQIALGNNTSVQEIFGTQDTHLALLTWQQKLLNGRIEFEVGRSVSNVAFTTSPLYCAFQTNAVCGNPIFVYFVGNSSGFPASRWAAHATAWPTPDIYVHVGAYEVNPDRGAPGDHGLRFDLDNATGAYLPFEIGYQLGGTRLPGHYQLGGWFDRSSYNDPLRDDAGQIAVVSGRAPARRFGRTGLYVRFDQRLTGAGDGSARGLSVFGVAMANVAGRVPSTGFLEAGLVQTGTFAGRDSDAIGFVITDQRLSDLSLQRLAAARRITGGNGSVSRHQIVTEVNYGVQLGRAVRLLPNVQYIINPDQLAAPFQRRASRDALVLGLRLSIDALALAAGRPNVGARTR